VSVVAGVIAGVPLWVVDTIDFRQVTVSTTPIILPVVDLADDVVVQVQGATVRLRLDGVDPTATTGHLLSDGDVIRLSGVPTIRQARFVRAGATDATLAVHYGRIDLVRLDELVRRGALLPGEVV